MLRFTTAATLLLLAAPAFANPTFDQVMVETDDRYGNRPAGTILWQKVTVTWEGEVEVTHFSAFNSDRWSGQATADELDAIEAAVKKARLGRSMPAEFSDAPWGTKFEVESSRSTLRGKTRGNLANVGSRGPRLLPLVELFTDLAERIIRPPALPSGQLRGRVELRGYTPYLNLGMNRRYEIEPSEMADALEALEGEWITVEGTLSGDSDWNREVEVTKLLDPAPGLLEGELLSGGRLKVGDRIVQLSANDDVQDVLEAVSGEVRLEGFVRSGPRGPKAMVVRGVRAVMTDRDYPFRAGDEVLLTDVLAWGSSFEAVRVSDGRSGYVDPDEVDTTPSAGASTGLSGALGSLGN